MAEAIRVCSAETKGEWIALPEGAPEQQGGLPDPIQAALTSALTRAMLSPNLLILCGLGTTRHIDGAPSMGDLWKGVEAAGGSEFATVRETVGYTEGSNVEALLSRCQVAEDFRPTPSVERFIKAAEAEITAACRFVDDATDLSVHETLLRKAARRQDHLPRLRVFSTNYDMCYERAAVRARFVVVDGFSFSTPQEYDDGHFDLDIVRRTNDGRAQTYHPNVFHLHKLHGSVDWTQEGRRLLKDSATQKPILIYPRSDKYRSSYARPFIDMMSRFQFALRAPDASLLVLGSGLCDDHIAQPLISAIRSNTGLKLVIVDPEWEGATTEAHELVKDLIVRRDARLLGLAATFEQFVTLLPDLVPETTQEVHEDRRRASAT